MNIYIIFSFNMQMVFHDAAKRFKLFGFETNICTTVYYIMHIQSMESDHTTVDEMSLSVLVLFTWTLK